MVENDSTDLELVTQELQAAGFEPTITTVEIERDFFNQLLSEHDVIIS